MSRQRFFIKEFMMTNQEAMQIIEEMLNTKFNRPYCALSRGLATKMLEILGKQDPESDADFMATEFIKRYNK